MHIKMIKKNSLSPVFEMLLLAPLITIIIHVQKIIGVTIVCDGIIFNEVYFERHIMVENYDRPYSLVMHKFSGILFFSHTIHNGSQTDFKIMACHLQKKECSEVKGVPGGYAIAYDAGNDDIYFGGHNGIYKYNFLTKTADFFAEEGKSIWGLFVKKNFYYIEYPAQKLMVYQDDVFVPVAEAIKIEIDQFFISKNNEIYFSNKTALFKIQPPEREPIVLNDEIVVRQIAEDGYGDVYFCSNDGIYMEDKPFSRLKKISDIEQAFGITFDHNDNVIYSDKDTIYRLLPSNYTASCYKAIVAYHEEDKATKI